MEILMVLTLAIMSVYFFKSTDLPKDLKERSIQLQAESSQQSTSKTLRITLPKELKSNSIENNLDTKLGEMKIQKKLKEIQVLNLEIDSLTMTITTLEQEIKKNNERNNEIQSIIDSHLTRLQLLQVQVSQLS